MIEGKEKQMPIFNSNISIICPSPKGKEIALKLQKELKGKLYIKDNNPSYPIEAQSENKELPIGRNLAYESFETCIYGEDFNLNTVTKEAMELSKAIIFISSTGIAVRAIAPFLRGKDLDPGVVVVDLCSKYAINILSGHLGGGNELTHKVSEILKAIPVITTASDNLGIIAPDILAKDNNLIIEDLKKAKYIASLLIDNKVIGVKDDYNIIKSSKGYEKIQDLRENSIWITHKLKAEDNDKTKTLDYSKVLRLIKKDIILGIGCRKDTSFDRLYAFINRSLLENNLDIRGVTSIVSVDVKAKEKGIIELADKINCPFKTFSREEITTVQDKYDKSEFVFKTLGITGVCEPSIDLAGGEIIINKLKHEGMTLAIGIQKDTKNT